MKKIIIYTLLLLAFLPKGQAQSLDAYLKQAVDSSWRLRAQYATYEAALEKEAQVTALPNPMVSASAFGSMIETRLGPQMAVFSASQQLPWPGLLKAKGKTAQLMAEAQRLGWTDSQRELLMQAKEAYYPMYEVAKMQRLQQANQALLAQLKQVAANKLENGQGEMADLVMLDMELLEIATELRILAQQEVPLKAQFNRLLARPLDASVALPDSLFLPNQAPLSALNDSLFASHPRLAMIAAEERVRVQEAELMRLEGKPMFEVGATYMAIGKRTDMFVPESGRDVFMPMVGVSVPIYRKKYEAGIREAQKMQLASRHQRAEAASMLRTAFEMAIFERKQAWELYQTNKQQLGNTQRLIELQLSSYTHTGQGFERLLQLQQRLLIFQTGMLKATTAYFTAQARLDYLLD